MTHISQWSQWVTRQPEIIDLFKFKAFFLFELKEKEYYCKQILKLQCVRLSPPFPRVGGRRIENNKTSFLSNKTGYKWLYNCVIAI